MANADAEGADEGLGLSVAWSRHDAGQVGEVLPVWSDSRPCVFGRGAGDASTRRVHLLRWHPGGSVRRPAECPRVSRNQLQLSVTPRGALLVENIGSCPMIYAGRETRAAELQIGETLWLQNELLFICVKLPRRFGGGFTALKLPAHDFGRVDALGIVGEGAAIWSLREQLVAAAAQPFHVLVLGASGSGKELVARAIHELSSRRSRSWVARNAATIPESLADAELFGNARGYPQVGMSDRPGLIGAAQGGSLFLDEIGELSHSLQARLLRVLDQGEYQRLGEAQTRHSDLRLIGATNRSPDELKHDLLARLIIRIEVPDLNARREDIPLLAFHLLRSHAALEPGIASRFFVSGDPKGAPRVSPRLMEQLVLHKYTTNVRELAGILALATRSGPGGYLDSAIPRPQSISPTAPPSEQSSLSIVQEPHEPWLSPEENARLRLLRKHRFSPTSCGRDSAYPGNRQTADLHLRHLVCRALDEARFSIDGAAKLLAGGDPKLLEKCRARISTFVSNLEGRVTTEAPETLDRALAEDYKGLLDAVLPLLSRLRAKHVAFPIRP